jgi:periplasmic divalent cation tolerance protein
MCSARFKSRDSGRRAGGQTGKRHSSQTGPSSRPKYRRRSALPSHETRVTNMPHTDAVVVLTTVANPIEAEMLVRNLLDRRLIACGTMLPGARSLYRWDGRIADEAETVLLLKTRSAVLDALEQAFAELHPYKVPELLALSASSGLEKYVAWINTETSLSLT